MTQHVDIHFWVEGDDPSIPTLHEELSATLERGWSRPAVKGQPMRNGKPASTNFTSLAIAEGLEDERCNPETNAAIQNWIRQHNERVLGLNHITMGIRVSVYLMPNMAYEGLAFTSETAKAAADVGCGLGVLTYRILERKEDSHPPEA